MLQDGNVMHLPNLTGQDVHRAFKMYSKLPKYVCRRMTHKPVKRAIGDDD
jgi:hypothetical protein